MAPVLYCIHMHLPRQDCEAIKEARARLARFRQLSSMRVRHCRPKRSHKRKLIHTSFLYTFLRRLAPGPMVSYLCTWVPASSLSRESAHGLQKKHPPLGT